jgi:hypothetical protein
MDIIIERGVGLDVHKGNVVAEGSSDALVRIGEATQSTDKTV